MFGVIKNKNALAFQDEGEYGSARTLWTAMILAKESWLI